MSNKTINLVQVIKEIDIDEILDDHIRDLVIIMFSSSKCGPCMNIKPTFIQTAKQKSNCFFIYIDITNYSDTTKNYTDKLKCTPRFAYYYNKQEIAYVIGQDEKLFIKTLNDIIFRINEKKEEMKRRNLVRPATYINQTYHNYPVQQQQQIQQPVQQQQVQQPVQQQLMPQPVQQQPIQQPVQQQPIQQPVQQQPIQQPVQQQPIQQPVQQQPIQQPTQQQLMQQPVQQQPIQQLVQQQPMQQQTVQQQPMQQQTVQQQPIQQQTVQQQPTPQPVQQQVQQQPVQQHSIQQLNNMGQNNRNDYEREKKLQQLYALNRNRHMQKLYKLQQIRRLQKIIKRNEQKNDRNS